MNVTRPRPGALAVTVRSGAEWELLVLALAFAAWYIGLVLARERDGNMSAALVALLAVLPLAAVPVVLHRIRRVGAVDTLLFDGPGSTIIFNGVRRAGFEDAAKVCILRGDEEEPPALVVVLKDGSSIRVGTARRVRDLESVGLDLAELLHVVIERPGL